MSNEEEKEGGSTKCHGGTVLNGGWLSHLGSTPGTAIVQPCLSLLPPACPRASSSASTAVIGCTGLAPGQGQPRAHDIPFILISYRTSFQQPPLENSICIKTHCNFCLKKFLPWQCFLSSYHSVPLLPFTEKLGGLSSPHCLQFPSSFSSLNPLSPGFYPTAPPKSALSRSHGLPCS